MRRDGHVPIESYAVISDQRVAALVAADGAIDWLCAPRFDDPPIAARLLDPERGGVFELRPSESFTVQRRYVEDTNVLETTWTTASGTVRVVDALAMAERIQRFSQLLRRVECLAGRVELEWSVRPRFGWDAEEPSVRRHESGHVLAHGRLELLVQSFGLREGEVAGGGLRGREVLAQGDCGMLSVLVVHDFPLLASAREQADLRLEETVRFWHAWLAPLRYEGPWTGPVRRSALALAACVHDETGALVAAPTTSLPERVGGPRNYDYRFCWVRDTAFALDASLSLGLAQAAQATLGWLLRAERRTHPRVNVFFTLDGEPYCPQQDTGLPGYRGSRPVVHGNAAGTQLQLGCFGDLMETAWRFVRSGSPLDRVAGLHLGEVADHVCEIWRNQDSGIWELEDLRDYTRSKAQCWVALDRALRLRDAGALEAGHPDRWRTTMAAIETWIRGHCIDAEGVWRRDGNGSGELDCAELLLPQTGLVEASDPGFHRTVARLRAELGAGGPLLYRYSGMRDEENAFLPCSFWLVEALAGMGRRDEAAEAMDELVGMANDVGLLSEELDPSDRSLVGNFPQALTHLSLLSAAVSLTER